jgi:aubergine-like protein
LKQHDALFNHCKAFDGMTLFSMKKLDNEVTELLSERKYDNVQIKVTIKLVNELSQNSQECLRMFNIIFKRCLMHCKLVEFGRDRAYYDFEQMHNMPNYGLKIAPGYKASLDIYASKLLLCTEVTHKLFNFSTVKQEMEEFFKNKNSNDSYKQRCMERFVGLTVMTQYNKKTYKIDDIAWDVTPAHTFDKKGTPISYTQYYYDQYHIRIKDDKQPMLISLVKNKDKRPGKNNAVTEHTVLLVPELCVLTGNVLLKEFTKDFRMKQELDVITKLNPEVRYQKLRSLLNTIQTHPEAIADLNTWQMEFKPEVLKLNAKLLPTVTVCFANSNTISNTERGWTNSLRNAEALLSKPLDNWVLFYMPRDEQKANYLNEELVLTARAMNFRLERAHLQRLPESRGSAASLFAEAIKDSINHYKPQMIVCIVPTINKDVYDSIKRVCCIEFGLPSQVVTSAILKTDLPKTKSVITKVAIQMNAKLGGEIWGVVLPTRSTMVIGMDFYKDSAQQNKNVCAFIASIDNKESKFNCTRYYSKCHLQPRDQGFSNCLEQFMIDALAKYRERNGILPDRIIVYRDGVSDGQFDAVSTLEVPQIRKSFVFTGGDEYK